MHENKKAKTDKEQFKPIYERVDEEQLKLDTKQQQEETTEHYLDMNQRFLDGETVAKKLDISIKTLITLGESGEFILGRVGGRIIVNKDSLLEYLDRYHFVGAESPDDEVVYDSKGNIKPGLTRVKEKHTEIPQLKKVSEFAKRLVPPLNVRSFIRHCDLGTFYHYRIGSSYKMSEEDWEKSLDRITRQGMKSARGGKKKQEAGQSSKTEKKTPQEE